MKTAFQFNIGSMYLRQNKNDIYVDVTAYYLFTHSSGEMSISVDIQASAYVMLLVTDWQPVIGLIKAVASEHFREMLQKEAAPNIVQLAENWAA